jgi:aspartate/methionine/tyrosine aminotransferase
MFFKPTRYMEFAKEMHVENAECVLAFSGIFCPWSLEELGVTARVLEKSAFYPYGHPKIKEIIAARYGASPEQILNPGGGSSLVNFLIGAAILGPGDAALVETPGYEPLTQTIAATGAQIIPLPRRAESGFTVDLDEFAALMRPPVKLAVVTRLHNPSGRTMSESDLLFMAGKAEEIGAQVLVDEVYLDFLIGTQARAAGTLHPRLITTSSLTKVCGLGDLRIGWAIAPPDLEQKCWSLNNVLGVNPPMIPDQIALELWQNGGIDRLLEWSRIRAQQNWEIVDNFLSNQNALRWVKPEGGIIVFLHAANGKDTSGLTDLLREKYKTLVMPGRFFDQPDGFRLGFGGPAEELTEGLRRIGLAVEEWMKL